MASSTPGNVKITTEIPSFLKQLARLITQGFYQIEDALIVDMLVRNSCMKEKHIEELLKFDLKMLRARLTTLKNEKIVQLRLRMETGLDGKAQKVNYYFINYKSLVNVVKYKLDHVRKKLETMERDATHRASFKCTHCTKTFTDLEAGELFDPNTQEFKCTFCYQVVVEDESSGPKTDSRFILARFNDQMKVIYDLLEKADGIKLAPELLEPEPPRSSNDLGDNNSSGRRGDGVWSGEATRSRGTNETKIDVNFGEEKAKAEEEKKERPIWLTESTIGDYDSSNYTSSMALRGNENPSASVTSGAATNRASKEDIMNVLLAFEKRGRSQQQQQVASDSDSDDDLKRLNSKTHDVNNAFGINSEEQMDTDDVEIMKSDDEGDDSSDVPTVLVGNERVPITEVNESIIEKMTDEEKEIYTEQFQDFYGNVFD